MILCVGQNLWSKLKNKADKASEVRKSVMSNMRRLATLYIIFKQELLSEDHGDLGVTEGNISDMFQRRYFTVLETAIEKMSEDGNHDIKAGLKRDLRYPIQTAAEIIQGHYLINNKDEKAQEIEKFMHVFRMKRFYLFGDAEYKMVKDRQLKLRKPEELPDEDDVQKVKEFVIKEIQDLTEDIYKIWTSKEYIEL